MSDEQRPQDQTPTPGGPGGGEPTPPEPVRTERAASVRLSGAATQSGGAGRVRMDAANQSLADALKITYRLVQVSMVALIALFVFSGLRTVNEGEMGLAVRFGRVTNPSLSPGPYLGFPAPIGEVVKVGTGTVELRVAREFFPSVQRESDLDKPVDELPSANYKLDPGTDGSLITADLNLAHAQFTVTYRRRDHVEWATNVIPDNERELVRLAVQRGVVRSVAETTIDDLLKDRDTVASRARVIAQETLDACSSGIHIEQLIMNRKFGPVAILGKFAAVQSAQQGASEAEESAKSAARSKLNAVAGDAADLLTGRIDEYERLTDLAKASLEADERSALESQAADTLATIFAIMEGREVTVDGVTYEAGQVSGEVTEILALAKVDAFRASDGARQDWVRFDSVHDQYALNPSLTLTREYAAAVAVFMGKPFVQSFKLRNGAEDTAEIRLNEDPDILDNMIRTRNLNQANQAADEREAARKRRRLEVDRAAESGSGATQGGG